MNRIATMRTDVPSRLTARFALVVLIAMFAFPALASAQSPSNDQYDEVPCVNCSQAGGGSGSIDDPGDPGDPSGLSDNVGPLPFTGFDVIAMIAVALAVTGVGLALQRAVARESTDQT